MAPRVRSKSKEQSRRASDQSNISHIQKSGGTSTKRGQIPRKRVVNVLPGNVMKTRLSLRSNEPPIRACRAAPLEYVRRPEITGVEERMEAFMDTMASVTAEKLAEINGYVSTEMNDIGQNLSSVLDSLLRTELVDFKAGVLSQLNTLVAAQVADEVAEMRREAANFQQTWVASMDSRVRAIEERFARQLESKFPECPVTSAGLGVAVDAQPGDAPSSMEVAGTGGPAPPGGTYESSVLLQRPPLATLQVIAENASPCTRKQGRAPAAKPPVFDLNVPPTESEQGEEEVQRVTRSMRRAALRQGGVVDLKRLGCVKGDAHEEQVTARWCLPSVFTRSRSLAMGSHKRAKLVGSSKQEEGKVSGGGRAPAGIGAGDRGGAGMEVKGKNKIGKGDTGRGLGETRQQLEGESSDGMQKLGEGGAEETSPATSPSQLLCQEPALTPTIHRVSSPPPVERIPLHDQIQHPRSEIYPLACGIESGEEPQGSALLGSPSELSQKLPVLLSSPEDDGVMPIPEAPTKRPRPGKGGGGTMEGPDAEGVVGAQDPGGSAGMGGEVKQHLEILHFGTTCLPSPYLASEKGGGETSGIFHESGYGSRTDILGASRQSEGLFPCLCRFCSPTFVEGGEEVECSAKDTAFRPRVIGSRICPAACFLDGGQGVLLAAEDGSCRYYDAVSWEERVQYLPPPGLSLSPVAGCWLVSAPWLNTDSTPLVVVTSAVGPAFCSWHFHTGVLAGHSALATCPPDGPSTAPAASCPSVGSEGASCHHPSDARWQDFVAPVWWAVPSGPLLAQGRVGWTGVALTDLRDGARAGEATLGSPVAKLRHSSPLQWADKKRLMVAERGGVGLWEVKGGGMRLAKIVEVPFGESVTALTAKGTAPTHQRRWSPFEAAFCTERALYVLDWRAPTSVHLKIPYTETRPADCLYLSDCQILAGVGGQPYEESTRILEWECGNGEAIDDFLLEKRTPGAHKGGVTQVWAGNGKVLGVHAGGLYIFQESPKYGQRPDNDSRLLAVVGRGLKGGLLTPKFYGDGDRVLLLSANHEPRMYTGV